MNESEAVTASIALAILVALFLAWVITRLVGVWRWEDTREPSGNYLIGTATRAGDSLFDATWPWLLAIGAGLLAGLIAADWV